MPEPLLPPHWTLRVDESPDALFYAEPRFVLHVDAATVAALAAYYGERLPAGARVLDLASSWVSHLPADVHYAHVAGLGMNARELAANPRLDEWRVHDLNVDPSLPWPDTSFDAVLCAFSVQYLTRWVEVGREVARVLVPGGVFLVATSHRLFPTKAIAAWRELGPSERLRLLAQCLEQSGGFDLFEARDRSPAAADPLWLLEARRAPA